VVPPDGNLPSMPRRSCSILALAPDARFIYLRNRHKLVKLNRDFEPVPFGSLRTGGRWEMRKVERTGGYEMKGREGDWTYVFHPEGEPVSGRPVTVEYKGRKITIQPHEVLTGPGICHLQDKGMCVAANGDICLPLAWGAYVGVSDEAIYAGDPLGGCVVRAVLTYAAEAVVEVK
jgi:hypothetical protein